MPGLKETQRAFSSQLHILPHPIVGPEKDPIWLTWPNKGLSPTCAQQRPFQAQLLRAKNCTIFSAKKRIPKIALTASKRPKLDPIWPNRGPTSAQHGPMKARHEPNMRPTCAQQRPFQAQLLRAKNCTIFSAKKRIPKITLIASKRPKLDPIWPNRGPTSAQHGPMKARHEPNMRPTEALPSPTSSR